MITEHKLIPGNSAQGRALQSTPRDTFPLKTTLSQWTDGYSYACLMLIVITLKKKNGLILNSLKILAELYFFFGVFF